MIIAKLFLVGTFMFSLLIMLCAVCTLTSSGRIEKLTFYGQKIRAGRLKRS